MKVLHVIPALDKGGAQRVIIDLSNDAVERGHSVTILTAIPVPANLMADQLRPEVELRCIRRSSRSWRAAYLALVPWMLSNREWLLSRDVVHCHLTYGSVFAAILQRIRGRRPTPAVVETYHAVGMAISKRDRAVHAALLSGRDAVAFMAEDPGWSRYMAARRGRLFRLILNGVAPPAPVSEAAAERFRTERTRIPAKPHAVVGSVGRLLAERRPDLLLETFVRLSKLVDRDAHLLLAGEGPERGALEAQARRHGLEGRVHLPGLVVSPAEPLAVIDLYLTVNVGPVTGIAALEAAFAGLPVIAVQLQQGYKADPGDWIWSSTDPAEVAARAAELVVNLPRRRMLAREQQAYVRAHHGVETMARAYERMYDDALAARRAGAGAGSRLVKEG